MLKMAPLVRSLGLIGSRATYYTNSPWFNGRCTVALNTHQALLRKGLVSHDLIERAPSEKQELIVTLMSKSCLNALLMKEQCSLDALVACDSDTLTSYTHYIVHCEENKLNPLNLNAFKALTPEEKKALTVDNDYDVLNSPAAASCGK